MRKGKEKRGSVERFTGIIVPDQWDAAGRAVGIAIATTAEEEYRISPEKKGGELFSLIRKRVEVAGTVLETHEGKILAVDEYILKEDSVAASAPDAGERPEQRRLRRSKTAASSTTNTTAPKKRGGKSQRKR